MSHAYSASTFASMRYKNLELGIWGEPLATNEKKSIWAMIDGNVLNANELRSQLSLLGFHFQGTSDAEILVHAYDAWGESFISKINGDFAIVLFDEESELLYLFRDRLGKKNLYWTIKGDYWLFSTEVKGLLSTGLVPQNPSIMGLASYLYFGFIPQDISPVKGVNKVLPGHFVKVDLGRRQSIDQFWSFSKHLEKESDASGEEIYHTLDETLNSSVQLAIPSDMHFGALLGENPGSCVLDYYIKCLAERKRYTTISAEFDQPLPKTDIQVHIEPEQALRDLVKIIWHLDEPIADIHMLQTWYMAEACAGKIDLVLADLGWDEMCAGHARYLVHPTLPTPHFTQFLARLPGNIREKLILPLCDLFYMKSKWRILRNIDIDRDQMAYQYRVALFRGKTRKKASPFLQRYFDPEIFTQRFHRLSTVPGEINPSLYFDAKTELPDRLLLQYERLFAAHGIRVITPYLDHRFVEFVAKVPEAIKIEKNTPAVLLRNLLQMHSPATQIPEDRMDNFLEKWRLNPIFRETFSLLESGILVDEGMISAKWVRQQLGYPYIIPKTFKQLWSLLVLEVWYRLYITKPVGITDVNVDVRDFLKR